MCHSLQPFAREHATALGADGGDRSVVSGRTLIGGLAAACGWGMAGGRPE